ncbi:MAG: UvrD-helicase domain-containing protein [Ignavibacteria bacterium]|jgi:ATP-dependent helicase/nuclease subunit A|nr:UvrD-helicase domain-containing protein [Ignavibacteria bacterium]MCU7503142.1 UvrD-helicase domain-containing protein [Ignavibacteria bacterium]MCU7518244.1 UvrD-helicase domain-containing protein [Ignavibacteria bacterium]
MSGITPHQKAALNYKDHISLTANAGSGKTFVLSRRYVEIALKENLSLRNIVAITFTDKAAGELYRKISEEVQRRYLESTDSRERKTIERIRRELVSANISTIHSFCIDILREFPLEAELDANFTPIDKNISDELLDLSVEETIKHFISDEENSGKLKYLLRIFASKNALKNAVATLIQKRKTILKLASGLYLQDEDEICRSFYRKFEQFVLPFIESGKERLLGDIAVINEKVLSLKPGNTLALEVRLIASKLEVTSDFKNLLGLLNELKSRLIAASTSSLRKQGYLDSQRETLHGEIKRVEDYFSRISGFELPEDHENVELELTRFGKSLISVFNWALASYGEKKRRLGYLDFEDILIFTQKILTRPEVSEALREKFLYIMIDEYQDTNEVQYEIFMPVLDYLRHGNLFVVGDEKQSIYMFRDAELKVFNRTKGDIMAASGQKNLLSLPESFRMSPAICLFTNYLFRSLFKDPDPLYNEVGYSDLVCAREESTPGSVEIILAGKSDKSATEAELIARRIISLLEEKKNAGADALRFDDIAVLCRKRKSFEELERAFNRHLIPFTILGGTGFYQKQMISDIYNYLSFLLNRGNDAALVSVLRSPFFSLSDVEIYEISLKKKGSFFDSFAAYAEGKPKLQEVASILSRNLALVNQYDIASLVRKIVRESSYLAVLSSKPNGLQEVANLEKLISISHDFSSAGYKTLYDFINYLESAIANIEDEGQALVNSESSCVSIMTIHQAKGLEFKAVFLYACHEFAQQDKVKAKSVIIDKDFGLLSSIPVNESYFEEYRQAPIVQVHNFISRKKNLAEIKRLLYVGVTRAKNYLFVSATYKTGFRFNPESFMGLILSGLKAGLPREMIEINFEQSFLKGTQDGYINEVKNLFLTIPVISDLQAASLIESQVETGSLKEKLIQTDALADRQQEETISATKVALYLQCPVKYFLTYEIGYSKLLRAFRRDFPQFSDLKAEEEEARSSFAGVKGKIMHELLEGEVKTGEYEYRLEEMIKSSLHFTDATIENLERLKDSISREMSLYLNSKVAGELRRYKNFRNEFEVLVREKEFYLYGIVDKVIFDGKKIIIIDYKSDSLRQEETLSRKESYLPQLKFYAYLISKLYPEAVEVELRLIFLGHPEVEIRQVLKKEDLEIIAIELFSLIDNLRRKQFSKNTRHCPYCSYFLDNRCVMQ